MRIELSRKALVEMCAGMCDEVAVLSMLVWSSPFWLNPTVVGFFRDMGPETWDSAVAPAVRRVLTEPTLINLLLISQALTTEQRSFTAILARTGRIPFGPNELGEIFRDTGVELAIID